MGVSQDKGLCILYTEIHDCDCYQSNKHQLINTSAAEQSCTAEVLCSCFWVKRGLSLQLHIPLSSPAASLLASPNHILFCSALCGLCCAPQVPPKSFEGDSDTEQGARNIFLLWKYFCFPCYLSQRVDIVWVPQHICCCLSPFPELRCCRLD